MELLIKMEEFLRGIMPYYTVILALSLIALGVGMSYGSERLQSTLRDRFMMITIGCAITLSAWPIAKAMVSFFS